MFKDPRTLLVFEFWRQADVELVPVGIFRHPVRVANSLAARSPMRGARGLRVWRAYNRILHDLHRGDEFPLLCFDTDSAGFEAQLGSAIEILRHRFTHPVELSDDAASSFFSADLIHNTSDTAELPTGPAAEDAERVARLVAGNEHLYAALRRRSLLGGAPNNAPMWQK